MAKFNIARKSACSAAICFLVLGVSAQPQQSQTCTISPTDLKDPVVKKPDSIVSKKADYYLLSLSWSPQFCKTPAGQSSANRFQCNENTFGFVVHGFWPQALNSKSV